MAVIIGSARGSFGNTAAGDQNGGKEVSTQNYYVHSKGWRVFVCNVPGAGALIAEAMKKACANNDIGYDQNTRNTLYNNIKDRGFDPSKTTKKVNTDCSALVRVCIQYAFAKLGVPYTMPDFITSNEPSTLLKSGYFTELTGDKYTRSGDYLPAGAILDTKTKGHTVAVITGGSKCDIAEVKKTAPLTLGDRILRNGMSGDDVKELQTQLIQLGFGLGVWGADGDFGDCTEAAVREFQRQNGCEIDGEVGGETTGALRRALFGIEGETADPKRVVIEGGNCYIRDQADTSGKILDVARRGTVYPYVGTSANGWQHIMYDTSRNLEGWVSGKYGRAE